MRNREVDKLVVGEKIRPIPELVRLGEVLTVDRIYQDRWTGRLFVSCHNGEPGIHFSLAAKEILSRVA